MGEGLLKEAGAQELVVDALVGEEAVEGAPVVLS